MELYGSHLFRSEHYIHQLKQKICEVDGVQRPHHGTLEGKTSLSSLLPSADNSHLAPLMDARYSMFTWCHALLWFYVMTYWLVYLWRDLANTIVILCLRCPLSWPVAGLEGFIKCNSNTMLEMSSVLAYSWVSDSVKRIKDLRTGQPNQRIQVSNSLYEMVEWKDEEKQTHPEQSAAEARLGEPVWRISWIFPWGNYLTG